MIGGDDFTLKLFAAGDVDRVSHVGMELYTTILLTRRAIFRQAGAAFIAKTGAEVVLGAALGTAVGKFPRRHGDEGAVGPFDDLEVTNDDGIVERDAAKRLEPFGVGPH